MLPAAHRQVPLSNLSRPDGLSSSCPTQDRTLWESGPSQAKLQVLQCTTSRLNYPKQTHNNPPCLSTLILVKLAICVPKNSPVSGLDPISVPYLITTLTTLTHLVLAMRKSTSAILSLSSPSFSPCPLPFPFKLNPLIPAPPRPPQISPPPPPGLSIVESVNQGIVPR